jgi:Fic/DOC family
MSRMPSAQNDFRRVQEMRMVRRVAGHGRANPLRVFNPGTRCARAYCGYNPQSRAFSGEAGRFSETYGHHPHWLQRLIDRYQLAALSLAQVAQVDTRVRGRDAHTEDDVDRLLFESRYGPEPTLQGDLQFALRYEGVNLEVLELLFGGTGPEPLAGWLREQSESIYARRAGFLYEWITGKELDIPELSSRMSYVSVLDESLQFGIGADGEVNRKFRVRNNLPGTREFCPLVRKTAAIIEMAEENLRSRAQETLSRYDPELIRRAAQYLYLKETRSSYEVEREKPSAGRIQRFVDLLRTAGIGQPLTPERFVELQNAVLEPRWHEFAYRSQQNWVGAYHHGREAVHFVPPRPEDVVSLMNGLCHYSARGRNVGAKGDAIDPVIHAAAVAFGFVFIHPFLDGNGRLHRFLIHEELSVLEFTPRGITLPVSAFVLANVDQYIEVLEKFSRPRLRRTEFKPPPPEVPARGSDAVYFRFFDATAQALFLFEIDWPGQSLDLFINIVRQGNGMLSKTKRASQFDWMTDEEIARFTPLVNQAFETEGESGDER